MGEEGFWRGIDGTRFMSGSVWSEVFGLDFDWRKEFARNARGVFEIYEFNLCVFICRDLIRR